jgi:hypothetical protein
MHVVRRGHQQSATTLAGGHPLGCDHRSARRTTFLIDQDVRLRYAPPDERATHHTRLRLRAGVTATAKNQRRAGGFIQRGCEAEPSLELGTRLPVDSLRTEHDDHTSSVLRKLSARSLDPPPGRGEDAGHSGRENENGL